MKNIIAKLENKELKKDIMRYIVRIGYNNQFLKDKYNITCITRQDFDLTDSFETLKYFSNKYFDIVRLLIQIPNVETKCGDIDFNLV